MPWASMNFVQFAISFSSFVGRLDVEIGQPFAHLRMRQGRRNGLVELGLDGIGNSFGSEEAEPEAQIHVRGLDAGFFQRRNVGQHG